MTQQELSLKLINIACCLANLADKVSTKLQKGGYDDSYKLIILNGYVNILNTYSLTDENANCITEEQFEDVLEKAINICDYCDCN